MESSIVDSSKSNSNTLINSLVTSQKLGVHTLNTNWVIWYHSPSDKSWTIDSYKSILEIETIEDYLVLKNSWTNCLPTVNEGMFFVMRKFDNGKVILPQWEDVNNKNGGYWSFKVDNTQAQEVWCKLCSYTIGETVCNKLEDQLTINGISISPKKTFCIIKIWNSNRNNNDINILSKELGNFLNLTESQYSSHTNNIDRDTVKVQRYKERVKDREQHRTRRNRGYKKNVGRF
jgi:hypothetical protein